MSMVEELQRDCAYCGQPITLKWRNGLTVESHSPFHKESGLSPP